jgi:23S rRNA (uracil1939-C5)-methyltransferase
VSRKKKNIVLPQVLVEDYAAEGKSLARVDGKVIFIEGAVPGDRVDVQLGRSKKDWAEGRAIRFHGFSDQRVEPFCDHFGICGGCQWQMLPYDLQLKYKEKQVRDNLQRIGKLQLPDIRPIMGAEKTRYYRNKIEYTFGNKRYLRREELGDETITGQQDVAGFHARGLFDKVVNIDQCHLQEEPTNELRKAICQWGRDHHVAFYDIRQHQGFLRTLQLRFCDTGERMANMVVGEYDQDKIEHLMKFIEKNFPDLTTLLYTVNTKHNDSLYDLKPVVWKGKGYVVERLEDFSFKIGPLSFFQTNTAQATRLYQVTREMAALTGSEVLYDLYCGTGSIGIFCSRQAAKIVGVELVSAAIDDARENASLNSLTNTAFFAGDVIDVCNDDFFAVNGRPDVIITDPPRAGMHEKLVRKILDMEAQRVVYVSCNPATQARDLQWLSEKYEVTAVQPVDMFPHTLHIENVAALELKAG